VWWDARLNAGGDPARVFGARITSAGALLDPSGIMIGQPLSFASAAGIAFNGTDYLVAMSTPSGLNVTIVSPAGVVATPQGTNVAMFNAGLTPSIATDGVGFLVVWRTNGGATGDDIHGRRVDGSGAPVGA
jgi:hypothetical protein